MKSTARIAEHPIHPMLIPYPFAFLSGALAFRMLASARHDATFARTADHLRTAGLATAVLAAAPGIIDYFTALPDGPPRRTATSHVIANSTALLCFAAAAVGGQRGTEDRQSLTLEAIGTAFLSLGGWLGGKLTYHHHVGVVEDAESGAYARIADA